MWHLSSYLSFSWDFFSLRAWFFPSSRLLSVAFLTSPFLNSCRHTILLLFQLSESFLLSCYHQGVHHGSFRLSASFFSSLRLVCVLFVVYRFWINFPFFGHFQVFCLFFFFNFSEATIGTEYSRAPLISLILSRYHWASSVFSGRSFALSVSFLASLTLLHFVSLGTYKLSFLPWSYFIFS